MGWTLRAGATVLLGGLAATSACFDASDDLRGQPCTTDASCGELSCSYGVCGGPQRCSAGAGVGDYCFTVGEQGFDVGAGPNAVAVGLVDADARVDVVVGNATSATLSLLVNDGAGGFAPAVESGALGDAVHELVIGRIDADGLADVLATTEADSLVVVPIRGDADVAPSFGPVAVAAASLASPSHPRIGNFVDDPQGTPDVATLVQGGLDVREQQDALVFGGELLTAVEGASDIRVIGQAAERAYVAAPSDDAIVSLSRNPNGLFSPRKTIDVGAGPERLVLEDLDLDGYADLLTVSDTGTISLTRGKDVAQGEWHQPQTVYELGWRPVQIAVADLDDDAALELVVAGGPEGGRHDVYLFDNDGDGRPVYGGSLGLADAAALALADLEPDGVPELVVVDAAGEQLRVARRTVAPPPPGSTEGTTGVDPTTPVESTNPTLEAGDPTLETGDPSFPGETGFETGVFPGNCEAGFPVGEMCFTWFDGYVLGTASGVHIEVGDATNDGYEDAVVADASGNLFLLESSQSAMPAPLYSPEGATWSLPAPATGLAIGVLDYGTWVPYVVATHELGISAREYASVGMPEPSNPIELEFEPTSHPVIAYFFGDDHQQVVFEHQGSLGFVDRLHDGGQPTLYDDAIGVSDVEVVATEALGYVALTASPAGIMPYAITQDEITPLSLLDDTACVSLGTTPYAGFFAWTDGTELRVWSPNGGGMLEAKTLGSATAIGDIEFGDFNADLEEDMVMIVGLGSGAEEVHVWLTRPGYDFEGPFVMAWPGAASLAVRRNWGDLGAAPSELLVLQSDGVVVHLVPEYLAL